MSIQLKAALLLLVFSLNTIIGFACAVGIDMRVNTPHHDNQEATDIHEPTDGVTHNHNRIAEKRQHEENKPQKKEKGGCCNDDVQKFQSLDKALNQNVKTVIDVPAFAVIISAFLGIDILNSAKAYPPKYKARYFYPPPSDIRIAIQRFQI
ncbi:MAG: hypothetical protein K2X48_19335 [Chitinophagaceae bacterium]|nr:hypothetical protein [Chitinophagaceae bacterium]